LIGYAIVPVGVRSFLKYAKSERRSSGRGFDLAVKIVTVTGMKEPTSIAAYGYTAVSRGMAGERYDHDICLVITERANALESEPVLAFLAVHSPLRLVTPLFADVAPLPRSDLPGDRGLIFAEMDMDCRRGEVRQASGMIAVEVRQKNMAHIVPREAECPDLFESCFCAVETRRGVSSPIGWKAFGISNIAEAESSIDKGKTVFGFNQQYVADEPRSFEETASAVDQSRAPGTHGSCIQMMDAHGSSQSRN